MLNNECTQCGQKFTVTDVDLSFYKKISPTFAEKTFEIPSPTLCPECRAQKRLVWRNEKKLYKRKSNLSGKNIISVFSPDKQYQVYEQSEWWSDKWDATKMGRDFNFQEPAFGQFKKLYSDVPKINLINSNPENSDYLSYARGNKDCYLLFSAIENEGCMYSTNIDHCKSCIDCLMLTQCTSCYETIESQSCFLCKWIQECRECSDSAYLYDCKGCDHCLFCAGLRRKSYHVFNEPVSKEEFKKFAEDLNTKSNLSRYRVLLQNLPRRCAKILKSENVTGDNIANCKDCQNIFDTYSCESCSYLTRSVGCKSIWDCDYAMASFSCEGVDIDENSQNTNFCLSSWGCSDVFYCANCHNSNHLFLCAGLRHKEYCILNKQYLKGEYEKLVSEIIQKMKTDGEWGEFFSMDLSPFGYNETVAMEYWPLGKEEASKMSAKWQDKDYETDYKDEPYIPEKNIKIYIDSDEKRQKLLSGVLKCEISSKPFKIMPQELAFYLENKIPIPTKHYDIRYKERFSLRNPRKLFHRQCMCEEVGHDHEGRCKNEFQTTYFQNRPEKVYCENCYERSVNG